MEPRANSYCVQSESRLPSCGLRRKWMLLATVLLVALSAGAASAQVIPGLVFRPDLSVYGTFPTNFSPTFAPFSAPVLFGYSVGGFYQTRHFIGAELRGTIQRRENRQHQESALVGPRLALHFGRVTPYSSLLIGAGMGWRFRNPPTPGQRVPRPVPGIGPQWTLTGGVDFHVSHNLAIRVGEVSFSELYLKNWDLTPVNFTAGAVWRLR